MGAVEAKLGNLSQRLLMPKEAPAHFAHGRLSSFPAAPANSLLLLSHIALATSDKQTALQFYVTGLGAGFDSDDQENVLKVHAGVTQLHLHPDGKLEGSRLAHSWPGHIYCWVESAKAVVDACTSIDPSMIEGVHNLTDEKVIDAVVLQEPGAEQRVVINPAPKGGLADKIRSLGSQTSERSTANLLAIMDVTHLIAPRTGEAVKRSYEYYLGAAVSRKKSGYVVQFSLGESLQQTLTFVEDESVSPVDPEKLGQSEIPALCVYMPSMEMFETSFERCSGAGIVMAPSSLDEAKQACQFSFQRCMDPESKNVALELLHVVRIQKHPECPLPAGYEVRRHTIEDEQLELDAPFTKLTEQEVAKHNSKQDAWVIINGRVLDVTDWIDVHPWHLIMGDFGKDVSLQWNLIHKPGTWEDALAYPLGPRQVGYVEDASNPPALLAGA